jgi:hypothetical protein
VVENEEVGDPQELSNREIPTGYDEETMDFSKEEFDAQPHWRQERLSQMAYKKRKAEEDAQRERGRREQLEKRLEQLEQRVQSQPREEKAEAKTGWGQFDDDQLRSYELDGWKAIQAAALNPESEELRTAAASYSPDKLIAVRDELNQRQSSQAISGLRGEIGEQTAAVQRANALQQKLQREFGPDVLNMESDLMKEAADQFRDLAQTLSVKDDEAGVLTYMSVREAYRKIRDRDRGGRGMTESDRRRLAVEGQVRRDTSPQNTIAALKAKGDWKSRDKAQDMAIDGFLAELGFTE